MASPPTMSTMQALMRAIQKAASPSIWSAGVELTRAGAVVAPVAAALRQEEIEVQVAGQRGGAAVWVSLWPQDEDWSCACSSTQDVCMHAAAAAIVCHQVATGRGLGAAPPGAGPQGAAAPTPVRRALGHVHYTFTSGPTGLSLAREVVTADARVPLNLALAVFARTGAAQVLAQPHDSAVDSLLAARSPGVVGQPLLHKLLKALQDAPHVALDGAPVTVGAARSAQVVTLTARPGGGVLVRLAKARGLTATFANGAGLFGTTLTPLTAPSLMDHERRGLLAGVVVPPERQSELFGTLLPRLAQDLPIDWGDVRRREEIQVPPLLQLQLDWERDEAGAPQVFAVLPALVYGDPPVARVVGETLRALGTQVPRRLKEAEMALGQLLERALQLTAGTRHSRRGAAGVALAEQVRQLAQQPQVVVHDPRDALGAFTCRGALNAQLDLRDHGFHLSYGLGHGLSDGPLGSRASAEAVQGAWQRQEPLVPLTGGGFATLPQQFLEAHGERVALLLAARAAAQDLRDPGAAKGAPGALPAWALPQLLALAEATQTPLPAPLAALHRALAGGRGDAAAAPPPLPPGLVLRPYQAEGVRWLTARLDRGIGVLLADDMGLGKTLQALLCRQGRTLVVAPTSVLFNWGEEAARLDPHGKICIYHGPNRRLDGAAPLTITSYGIVRQDGAALLSQGFDTLILDEAQVIKNPSSQTAQAAFALSTGAKRRLALTGTPVENRLDELWSQCHFLNPGLLGTLGEFKRTVADPIALGASPEAGPGSPALAQGQRAARDLRQRLAPVLLRRTKAQVAQDLPPRTDVVLRCTLTADERAVYNSVQAATRAQVLRALQAGGTVMQALEALLRLRQAACHSALVPGQQAATSSKVQLLLHTLQEALQNGHRALVFSQWTSLLDRIEPHLRQHAICYLRLDGATRDRGDVVRRFVAPDGPPVLLASLKAGGVGLNLTAADHVFLLDPWWNPAAEDQAADRAHRIGQDRPVLVHRLVAENTVEEHILRLQGHKRALAAAALNDGSDGGDGGGFRAGSGKTGNPQAGLTRDDLWALLGEEVA